MIVFLQARCSSSRFPGKVLSDLGGMPMIIFQIKRILRSRLIKQLFVLTSREESDDELCRILESHKIEYFRGNLADVNSRFRDALVEFGFSDGYVMRLTADCPLICPELLDYGIESIGQTSWDYLSNTVIRTFPDGLDFEIFNIELFLNQRETQLDSFDREHVTPYFYRNPTIYSLGQVVSSLDYSHIRVTVDFREDLLLVDSLINQKGYSAFDDSYSHLLKLYHEHMLSIGVASDIKFNYTLAVKEYKEA